MRFTALLLLAGCVSWLAGCASSTRRVRIALQLTGTGAGPAEQKRCTDAATQAGAIVDANAPVEALVTLEQDGTRRLQVVSMRQGLVRDEKRGPASIETVCQDAAAAAASVRASPIETAPGSGDTTTAPPPSPSTSGGAYRGPISEH